MRIPLIGIANKIKILLHKLSDDPVYHFAIVFDYAQGRYEPMSQYKTVTQILTLIEQVISGSMGETVILVCWSGGGEPLNIPEFGDVCVCWTSGYEHFRWEDGTKTIFKDAFTKACRFIKTGKKK